jgi:hypothetical protein
MAGVAGMLGIDEVRATERGGDRQHAEPPNHERLYVRRECGADRGHDHRQHGGGDHALAAEDVGNGAGESSRPRRTRPGT